MRMSNFYFIHCINIHFHHKKKSNLFYPLKHQNLVKIYFTPFIACSENVIRTTTGIKVISLQSGC